jgi:hypothetical protein
MDEAGLVISTNDIYNSSFRSAEEMVDDIFEQRTLIMYLKAR